MPRTTSIDEEIERCRLQKAAAIADVLRAHGITAELAVRMTSDQWRAVAECAHVNHVNPPSPTTRRMVVWDLVLRTPK